MPCQGGAQGLAFLHRLPEPGQDYAQGRIVALLDQAVQGRYQRNARAQERGELAGEERDLPLLPEGRAAAHEAFQTESGLIRAGQPDWILVLAADFLPGRGRGFGIDQAADLPALLVQGSVFINRHGRRISAQGAGLRGCAWMKLW